MLYISKEAKRVIDNRRVVPARRYPDLVPAPPAIRTDIRGLFHMNYTDARPPFLRQAHLFSHLPRTQPINTHLQKHHVQAALAMALKLDVYAQRGYNNTERLQAVTTKGEIVNNLLSTFLDAVLLGYLEPTEQNYVG